MTEPRTMFVADWQLALMLATLGAGAEVADLELHASNLLGYDVTIKTYDSTLPPMRNDNEFVTGTGQTLRNVHAPSVCHGQWCLIHNPSEHSMRDFPTHWREDRGFMERICPHGVGHPDPDDPIADPIHGCDGCCG